jgi:hypothetical protein
MDLNEKLAARRKELNVIAQDKAKLENSQISAAVQVSHPSKALEHKVSPEADDTKRIAAIANARITPKERQSALILGLLGLVGFFFAWWLGVFFLVLAFISFGSATNRHVKQVTEEESERMKQNTDDESYRKWRDRIGLKD